MQNLYNLLIVGAGPGGLAAAVSARTSGLSVLLINEQNHLGGQIYHSLETMSDKSRQLMGKDFQYGENLIADFRSSGADYMPGTGLVSIDSGAGTVCCIKDEKTFEVSADQIIVSAGAMERPVPIPGWTLPGVMGAASVDVLLKQSDIIPSGKVVFAGSGPLMLSVICHMIDCKVKIAAILDTSCFKNMVSAMPHALGMVSNPGLLVKGMAMLAKIRAAGIPVIKGASGLKALGQDRLESIQFDHKGTLKTIETDLLLLHEGLIPNTQISRLIGCDHEWITLQQFWKPVTDRWGQTSAGSVSLVGDCTGIYGARAAEYAGYIAGIQAAYKNGCLKKSERDEKAGPYFRLRNKEIRFRPFIDAVYPPNADYIIPRDPDTIICRCEEIRLSTILKAIENGYESPVTIKNNTRSGMGRCQGRMCGPLITHIIARQLGKPHSQVGTTHVRSMLKPLTLSQLAGMKQHHIKNKDRNG